MRLSVDKRVVTNTYTKSLTALRAHSVEFEIHSWKFKHNIHWLGMEQTPGSEKSGNRCSKPDPRYPTRLSVKVLISRITVYSILTVPFFYERSLHGARVLKIAAPSIDWLQHDVFHETKLEILMTLSNTHRVNLTQTRGPDLSLQAKYQTRHRFSLFVPPLILMWSVFLCLNVYYLLSNWLKNIWVKLGLSGYLGYYSTPFQKPFICSQCAIRKWGAYWSLRNRDKTMSINCKEMKLSKIWV